MYNGSLCCAGEFFCSFLPAVEPKSIHQYHVECRAKITTNIMLRFFQMSETMAVLGKGAYQHYGQSASHDRPVASRTSTGPQHGIGTLFRPLH